MVLVSGDIKGESSNFGPVNFISANEVKDGTYDTLTEISYKDTIYTIQPDPCKGNLSNIQHIYGYLKK